MDFYLNRGGRNEGPFPLYELRRRRESGELGGSEHVWREGMTGWQSLDAVLAQNPPASQGPLPPPVPAPARKRPSNQGTNWGVVTAYSLFAVLVVAVTIYGVKFRATLDSSPRRTLFQPYQAARQQQQEALAAARKPVTWTSNTLTMAEAKKIEARFTERQWITGYQEHGDHSAACDAEAEQFLRTWLDRLNDVDTHTNLPATAQLAENLATNPACADPLLLAATAMNSRGWSNKTMRLELALNGFENSKYNGYVRLFAALQLRESVAGQTDRVTALDAKALTFFREALGDGSFTAAEQEVCAEKIMYAWSKNFFLQNGPATVQAARDAGKTFEWLALVLEGQDEINQTWKARGNEFDYKVTPQGREGFIINLAAARKACSRAWALDPSLPMAPSEMIQVAEGDSGIEEMRMWFDRTVMAQIDYPAAWSTMRNGLRPRWYGSLEAMLEFGVTAANTDRFDTVVPGEFMGSVRDIEIDQQGPRTGAIYGNPEVWLYVQRVCEGYLATPLSAAEAEKWRSRYAVAAYLARQYRVARSQLEFLNWKLAASERLDWGVDLSLMNQEVAAHTSPNADNVAAAEAARDRGDLDQALNLYNQILAEQRIGPRVRQFARARAASLDTEIHLKTGEWVDFMPDPTNNLTWSFVMGQPVFPTNGVVEVDGSPGGHALYSRVRVGRNFEVKGDFEFSKSVFGEHRAGLVMGMPEFDSKHGDWDWYGFQIRQAMNGEQTASFSVGWSTSTVTNRVVLHEGINSFTFRLQGDRCSATVNGRPVFINQEAPGPIKASDKGFLLGLGAYDWMQEIVSYQNIQVRKISP
ncbi:MAG TPA: DUF4339 domain-containing protein [Verrucomicrobiae bacterium]|nr:DUF4339 domain-containing protein [Verrucomicrobiae bacterium]